MGAVQAWCIRTFTFTSAQLNHCCFLLSFPFCLPALLLRHNNNHRVLSAPSTKTCSSVTAPRSLCPCCRSGPLPPATCWQMQPAGQPQWGRTSARPLTLLPADKTGHHSPQQTTATGITHMCTTLLSPQGHISTTRCLVDAAAASTATSSST